MKTIEWKCDECGETNVTEIEEEDILLEWAVAIPGGRDKSVVVECKHCGVLRKVG